MNDDMPENIRRQYEIVAKEEEKKRRKDKFKGYKVLIVFFVIIIVFIAAFGFIYWNYAERYDWSSSYILNIKSTKSGNYSIIVPLALKNKDDISLIMDEIKVNDGQASYKIVDTQYGKGLKIEGNGDVKLSIDKGEIKSLSHSEGERLKIFNVSMWNNFSFVYKSYTDETIIGNTWMWVYAQSSFGTIDVSISLHWFDMGEGRDIGIHGELNYFGWQYTSCHLLVYHPI